MRREDALKIVRLNIERQCGSMQAALRTLVPELGEEGEKEPETGGWVARDKDGFLSLFLARPVRDKDGWKSGAGQKELDRKLFPDVNWEDAGPKRVELAIREA